jgi:hypothetical protein
VHVNRPKQKKTSTIPKLIIQCDATTDFTKNKIIASLCYKYNLKVTRIVTSTDKVQGLAKEDRR